MNILLSGSSGFIGKNLSLLLSKKGHKVFTIHHRDSCQTNDLKKKRSIIFRDNFDELIEFINKNKIDVFIHLATLYLPSHSREDLSKLITGNVLFGAKILEAIANTDLKNVINVGTSWQNEESNSPVNLYAATKTAFKNILRFYLIKSKLKVIDLKLFDTYGENDSRKKIVQLISESTKNKRVIKMSPGDQKLNLLHVEDVCLGIIKSINLFSEINYSETKTYELKDENSYSLKNIAKIIEELSSLKANIDWGALPYRENEVMKPIITYPTLPGWKQKISLKDGLKRILKNTN